jgi:hypothetical protein
MHASITNRGDKSLDLNIISEFYFLPAAELVSGRRIVRLVLMNYKKGTKHPKHDKCIEVI